MKVFKTALSLILVLTLLMTLLCAGFMNASALKTSSSNSTTTNANTITKPNIAFKKDDGSIGWSLNNTNNNGANGITENGTHYDLVPGTAKQTAGAGGKYIDPTNGKQYDIVSQWEGTFSSGSSSSGGSSGSSSGGSSSGSSGGSSSSGGGGGGSTIPGYGGSGYSGGGGGSYYTPEPTPAPPPPPPPGFISIVNISPVSYPRWSASTATVTVTNSGGQSISGTVSFTCPNLAGEGTQGKSVTLDVGQTTTLDFNFLSPKTGTFTLTASANDSKSVTCSVTGSAYTPPTDGATGDTITWTEAGTHNKTIDTTNGSKTFACDHSFTYRATLTVTATLTPSTLKAGYGFEVSAGASVSTTQIAQGGDCSGWTSRTSTLTPTPPTVAKANTSWAAVSYKMKNGSTKTQSTTITLDSVSSSGTNRTWQAPKSPISETSLRKIYTHVDMRGTQSSPVNHNITFSFTSGGITARSLAWNKTLTKQITINGVLYEDDHTGG